jgi:alanine transaminase
VLLTLSILSPLLSQVAALTEYPALMDTPEVAKAFPTDTQERAKQILEDVGSVGAYSHSKGAASIRKDVASFIEGEKWREREGYT